MRLKNRVLKEIRALAEASAESKLRAHADLWRLVCDYVSKTKSARVTYSGFLLLYQAIRARKPVEVLECGTGFSTLALAYALWENERDGLGKGRLTSMEDHAEWMEMSKSLLPEFLRSRVEFRLSPRKEYYYSIYRGVGYAEIPSRDYDFVFIDGPFTVAPSDGFHTFDIDFIRLVSKSDRKMFAQLDQRFSTAYVFQKIFGKAAVRFDLKTRQSLIGPVSRSDLLRLKKSSSNALSHSIRFFGRTHFSLDLEKET